MNMLMLIGHGRDQELPDSREIAHFEFWNKTVITDSRTSGGGGLQSTALSKKEAGVGGRECETPSDALAVPMPMPWS